MYYTKGDRIEILSNENLKECLVVIDESSFHYKKVDNNDFYIGYIPNSSKTNIYLFKDGYLYLMEKDGHPDVSQDSYKLTEQICTMPNHIEVFNEEVKHILSAKGQNTPVLTKKRK